MKIHRLVSVLLIAIGFDATALPQIDKARNAATIMGNECTQSIARPFGKYSKVRIQFTLILKTSKRLPVEAPWRPECSRPKGNAPDRELKFLVRPHALARIRKT